MTQWSFASEVRPEAVFDACLHAMSEPPPAGVQALFDAAGSPVHELSVTPVSARVSAAALLRGHDFVHHELRVPVPGEKGDATWVDGVFEISKYAQARLEAPLATYEPNHRVKWRAHELLHRRVGFFWRPEQSPFEVYLGARLSELLPVVHWYGFDEAFRPRCNQHVGERLFREHCPACEACACAYWDQAPLSARARGWARSCIESAFEHLTSELSAIDAERADGRRRPSVRGPLDASSDARAYANAHWERLTAWSFGSWVELFCVPGVDYCTSVSGMRAHVDAVLAEILCARLNIEPERAGALRARQALRELGYRALQAIELADDDALERALWPALEAAGNSCREASHQAASAPGFDEAGRALYRELERLGYPEVGELGGLWVGAPLSGGHALAQVRTGLMSGLPDNYAVDEPATDEPLSDAEVANFISSPSFRGPGELRSRYVEFLGTRDDDAGAGISAMQAVALEHFLRARPHTDEEAADFATLPEMGLGEAWPPGRLRLHATFRREKFSAAAIHTILGWDSPAPAELARVFVDGAARVVEVEPDIADALDAVGAGETVPYDELCRGLLEARLVVWLPHAG